MGAAQYGKADTVKLLLEAGALIEATGPVSKKISICTCVYVCMCVCVIFLHHSVWYVKSVVLFYSCILSLWYVGYDDFIRMNNVFVFVLIIIISLLVLLLANMKIAILEKYLFSISDEFLHFFFILFIFVSPLYTYFW